MHASVVQVLAFVLLLLLPVLPPVLPGLPWGVTSSSTHLFLHIFPLAPPNISAGTYYPATWSLLFVVVFCICWRLFLLFCVFVLLFVVIVCVAVCIYIERDIYKQMLFDVFLSYVFGVVLFNMCWCVYFVFVFAFVLFVIYIEREICLLFAYFCLYCFDNF